MQTDKSMIFGLLRQQAKGKADQANQADQAQQKLPDQVDTDQHAVLLEKFGLSPQELIAKVAGGGGLAGGLAGLPGGGR